MLLYFPTQDPWYINPLSLLSYIVGKDQSWLNSVHNILGLMFRHLSSCIWKVSNTQCHDQKTQVDPSSSRAILSNLFRQHSLPHSVARLLHTFLSVLKYPKPLPLTLCWLFCSSFSREKWTQKDKIELVCAPINKSEILHSFRSDSSAWASTPSCPFKHITAVIFPICFTPWLFPWYSLIPYSKQNTITYLIKNQQKTLLTLHALTVTA